MDPDQLLKPADQDPHCFTKRGYIALKSSGRIRISGKGVHMYKGVRVRFADFLSFS